MTTTYQSPRHAMLSRRLANARSQLDALLARGYPVSICRQQADHCGHIREQRDAAVAKKPANWRPTKDQREEFATKLRSLNRQRLNQEIGSETFLKLLLFLHRHYGRCGFDQQDYDREIAEHEARRERARVLADENPWSMKDE